MPWAKLDDQMWGHPKFMGLSNAAVGLWARALSYAAGHLTDGFIPSAFVERYMENGEVAELLDVGLWLQNDVGYIVHDWAEYQPSAASVVAKRQASADRMRQVRQGKGGG